ncbi:hypothetical protein PR048_017003 [Dryococelus australis]|uniref:Uncharacterized protein n=1 Tax=Dryococelus australis TaxID=614101 RepID=A0ABQ9H8A4_9NEOP|nr:hypothetical protein PR048_017003 [Dryococelus australis]
MAQVYTNWQKSRLDPKKDFQKCSVYREKPIPFMFSQYADKRARQTGDFSLECSRRQAGGTDEIDMCKFAVVVTPSSLISWLLINSSVRCRALVSCDRPNSSFVGSQKSCETGAAASLSTIGCSRIRESQGLNWGSFKYHSPEGSPWEEVCTRNRLFMLLGVTTERAGRIRELEAEVATEDECREFVTYSLPPATKLKVGECPESFPLKELQYSGECENLRADNCQTRSMGQRRKGGEKREIPEKTRRPAASSGTIPTCEKPGIEPGSPRWEAGSLTATPPRPPYFWRVRVWHRYRNSDRQCYAALCVPDRWLELASLIRAAITARIPLPQLSIMRPLYRTVQHSLTLLLPASYWLAVKRGVSKELSSNYNSRRKEQEFGVYLAYRPASADRCADPTCTGSTTPPPPQPHDTPQTKPPLTPHRLAHSPPSAKIIFFPELECTRPRADNFPRAFPCQGHVQHTPYPLVTLASFHDQPQVVKCGGRRRGGAQSRGRLWTVAHAPINNSLDSSTILGILGIRDLSIVLRHVDSTITSSRAAKVPAKCHQFYVSKTNSADSGDCHRLFTGLKEPKNKWDWLTRYDCAKLSTFRGSNPTQEQTGDQQEIKAPDRRCGYEKYSEELGWWKGVSDRVCE